MCVPAGRRMDAAAAALDEEDSGRQAGRKMASPASETISEGEAHKSGSKLDHLEL